MSSRGVLYDVFAAQAEALAGSIPDDLPEHRFSLGYRRKERAVLKAYERSRKNSTEFSYNPPKARIKPKYFLIAIIFACIVALTGSFLVWYHISGFTFKREQTNSTVYADSAGNSKIAIEEVYYIPDSEGVRLVKQTITSGVVLTSYDIDNHRVILNQILASFKHQVNTEGFSVEPIKINGYDGYFIQMGEDNAYVSWTMDGYVFSITSNLDKQKTIELAQAVMVEE